MTSSMNLEAALPQYWRGFPPCIEGQQDDGGGDLAGCGEDSCKSGAVHRAEDEDGNGVDEAVHGGEGGEGVGGESRGKAGLRTSPIGSFWSSRWTTNSGRSWTSSSA